MKITKKEIKILEKVLEILLGINSGELEAILKKIKTINGPEPKPKPKPKPEPKPAPVGSWRAIKWISNNYSRAKINKNTKLRASVSGNMVHWDYKTPQWPIQGGRVRVNAIACFFVWDGEKWVGGKFDWVRPGQKSKTLKNIHEGYGGLHMPPKGTQVAFALVSLGGRYRTNLAVTRI